VQPFPKYLCIFRVFNNWMFFDSKSIRVKSHTATDSQSVSPGIELPWGLMTRFWCSSDSCCFVSYGAPPPPRRKAVLSIRNVRRRQVSWWSSGHLNVHLKQRMQPAAFKLSDCGWTQVQQVVEMMAVMLRVTHNFSTLHVWVDGVNRKRWRLF